MGFPGQHIRQRHCRGRNCSTQVTVKFRIGPHSSYNLYSNLLFCYRQHCAQRQVLVFKLLRGRFLGFSPCRHRLLNSHIQSYIDSVVKEKFIPLNGSQVSGHSFIIISIPASENICFVGSLLSAGSCTNTLNNTCEWSLLSNGNSTDTSQILSRSLISNTSNTFLPHVGSVTLWVSIFCCKIQEYITECVGARRFTQSLSPQLMSSTIILVLPGSEHTKRHSTSCLT